MEIDIINDFETFQAIRSNWEFVYASDLQAQFSLSWIWLSEVVKQYVEHIEHKELWFVLAAKPKNNTNYVAFLPLSLEVKQRSDIGLYNQLSLVGITDADHAGFICLPGYEEEVASDFATYIQRQETWSKFELDKIPQEDRRLKLFLQSFPQESFEVHENQIINTLDQIDNSIIPYVSLPDTWEQYLQDTLSSNTRQKIKRLLKKVESSDEFYLTHVNAENLERHIEILFNFWRASWEGRKGSEQCQMILERTQDTLYHCFDYQCLYFPVLWKGIEPLGAIANLIDSQKKTVSFLIGGRDDTVKDLPVGIILHAYAIRDAINKGFKVYDFLVGNEAYKFSFGAQERRIKTVTLQRPNFLSQARKLDLRTIPQALKLSVIYHRLNQLHEAEQGYRQILAAQPNQPEALYNLAVIMQRREEYQTAESLLKNLLQVQSNNPKAWFSLGTLYQIQGQLAAAESAYQQALALQSESSVISLAVYHNLGYTLQQQGKLEAAIACYRKAQELQPDSVEAAVGLANALQAQGKLSPEERTHYAEVNCELGNKRQQAGDLKVAIEYYRQAIALNSELGEAYYCLGLALQKQNLDHWEEVVACYQKAWELQPDSLEAEVGLANALYAQGKLATNRKGRYAIANYELGKEFQEAGSLKRAIEYYRQAIILNPTLIEAYCFLGFALRKRGREHWEEAVACYQKAQALQPDSLEAAAGLANVLHLQGKLSADQQQHYAVINYELGTNCQQAGDLGIAIEYYKQAIAMNPELSEVRDRLRLALQEQGDVQIKVSCAKR
jgi:tetratricopeptide (TPR) repeat protein